VTSHNREHVYYLNKKGLALLGIDAKEQKKKHQLEHILLRNEAWMWLDFPEWKTEQVITLRYQGEEKQLFQSIFFTKDNVPHFVEIDRLQHMSVNEKKIQYYAYLTNIYQKQQHLTPIIIFCTISDCREKQLMNYAMKYGVYMQTYLLQDVV
jgi:hypothetical protein